MGLSERLMTIVDFVEKNSKVGDIGTDHAYIPEYLYSNNISKYIIASDINKGPLKNAENYLQKEGLKEKIELRLGPGLEPFKVGEIDTAIIAGMGGNMIGQILEDSKDIARSINRFILQPMTGIEELRRYLNDNNYRVIDEKLAKEGSKYYQIILVGHGNENIADDIFFEISESLLKRKDDLLVEFICKKLEKTDQIIEGISDNSSKENIEKREKLKKRRDKLREVIADVS